MTIGFNIKPNLVQTRKKGETTKFDNDILISRRSAVAAALLGCSSLILPTRANALGVESYALDSAPRLVYPDLNDEQVDELVHLNVVYEKKDGVRKVYAKNATREFYSIALGKRQVK